MHIWSSTSIEGFVSRLAGTPSPANAFNMYRDGLPQENATRCANLSLYLNQIQRLVPTVMLLSEAPGYLGCRRTGVPFTSEYLMLGGIQELGLFGTARGYAKALLQEPIRKEQSATIVWKTLARLQFVPLIWSSYPFHPHKPGNPDSNRPPTRAELELGRSFITELSELFGIATIAAVGRKAEATLADLGITPTATIRHPANGGAVQFAHGVEALHAAITSRP